MSELFEQRTPVELLAWSLNMHHLCRFLNKNQQAQQQQQKQE